MDLPNAQPPLYLYVTRFSGQNHLKLPEFDQEGSPFMNKAALNVLRKLGTNNSLDQERQERLTREVEEEQQKRKNKGADQDTDFEAVPDELLTESEKRHEKYRRQQAMAGRFTPAAERLPIMTAEERAAHNKDRPKWQQTSFEGPIEKLIEKYKDLAEVQRHLTLGQSMKYEFTTDGQVLDKEGNVIFDGEKIVPKSS